MTTTVLSGLDEQGLKRVIARHRGWIAIKNDEPLPEHDEYLERPPALADWLSEASNCPKQADLRREVLSRANLSNADLRDADLRGAELGCADL